MEQLLWTRKRAFWTIGMGMVGVFLSLKGIDTSRELWWIALGVVWASSIGYGLGTIFDQQQPTARLVIYCAITLALIGPCFSVVVYAGIRPYASTAEQVLAAGIGAISGAILGLLIGFISLRRFRRRTQAS